MYSANHLNHGHVAIFDLSLDLFYGHDQKCSSHCLNCFICVPTCWLLLIGTYSLSIPVDRRQGSTDSDEHARPKKKKTATKKKKRAPSTSPSASDPDDVDYVGEEEDDGAPSRSIGQSKPGTRRAPVPQVRGSALPIVHGRRISMELPDSGGRPTHDFTTVRAGQYLQFRRDVNQYEMVADAEDPRY